LEKHTLEIVQSPKSKLQSLELWLTIVIVIGAGVVYASLYLQSAVVFLIGQGVCLIAAPINLWLERKRIGHWWHSRGKCPECGGDLRHVNGACPGCGHKRIV
jgi:hypothetical protein